MACLWRSHELSGQVLGWGAFASHPAQCPPGGA
eukprot:CAMPEP_0179164072 /NCGR_PEP_ID=MMETSP0796-20121207/80489_1 /TAXON_ID=73915 /ORGANISM="Pyrodinium bahamense, Strain pbaha01" /LENGTH=32 /DNA_ID= /DNA_START= /DNA_END= /DNA_ORIENTATION=